MNPYEVLDIAPGASAEEIKAAYHGMAKKWHPDRYTGEAKAEAEQRFRMLAEAYNMLKDAPQRETPVPPPPPPVMSATPTAPPPLEADGRPVGHKTAEAWYQEAKAAAEAKAPEKALGLIQYAIRLGGDRAEFHALYGRLLDLTGGDKRTQVRALETALRLNPRDADTTILLAQTFEALGMHARAGRLWTVASQLAPNHPHLPGRGAQPRGPKAPPPKGRSASRPTPADGVWSSLVNGIRDAVNRIFKRG
jgi:tetratricopeptide (TPR) repeat protein